jgi:hypothetical protein
MTTVDDRALAHVLDGTPADPDDTELADAIARAEHDLARIRRALQLVAADEPASPSGRRRGRVRTIAIVAAVAAVAAAVIVAVGVSRRDDDEPSQVVAPAETTESALGADTSSPTKTGGGALSVSPDTGVVQQGMPATTQALPDLVRDADRVVVGRIARVDRGTLASPGEPEGQGMAYALATISVQESLKPAGDSVDLVVAFDYDYGAMVTPDGGAGGWEPGQEVLVFLVSDAGTVSADLQPAHLQLMGGAGGRFAIVDGQLQAPFTLDDVRSAVAASG